MASGKEVRTYLTAMWVAPVEGDRDSVPCYPTILHPLLLDRLSQFQGFLHALGYIGVLAFELLIDDR